MELVILIGLQASGKSTFRRLRFDATHVVVSKDLFRNNRHPARRQAQLVREALEAGRSVVIDNTNPTVESRAPLIAEARAHGASVSGYYFESSVADCVERNARRAGRARVAEVGLYATAKLLVRPRRVEGFDQLWYVRLSGLDFVVQPSCED